MAIQLVDATESLEFKQAMTDAYLMGRYWKQAGNTKLPRTVSHEGVERPIVRSTTSFAMEFVKGWKSC